MKIVCFMKSTERCYSIKKFWYLNIADIAIPGNLADGEIEPEQAVLKSN